MGLQEGPLSHLNQESGKSPSHRSLETEIHLPVQSKVLRTTLQGFLSGSIRPARTSVFTSSEEGCSSLWIPPEAR